MTTASLSNTDRVGVREFGSALQRTRLLRDWSVPQLARESGMSVSTIKNYESGYPGERGRLGPQRPNVVKLATALDVDPDIWLVLLGQRPLDEEERQQLRQRIMPGAERHLLELFRRLTPANQQLLVALAAALVSGSDDDWAVVTEIRPPREDTD